MPQMHCNHDYIENTHICSNSGNICVFYVVVVAVVVVIVDVDDEEGEGEGEDAQRRKSNNPNLKGFLSCMNLYHIHIVRMQCFARCMLFSAFTLPFHCIQISHGQRR